MIYCADKDDPWEYVWVGFTGSDAEIILKATDFSQEQPFIKGLSYGDKIHRQILHIYDARGNEFDHAVEMTGRLYTTLALFMHEANNDSIQHTANSYVQPLRLCWVYRQKNILLILELNRPAICYHILICQLQP